MTVRMIHPGLLQAILTLLLLGSPAAQAMNWDLAYQICVQEGEITDDPLPVLTGDKVIPLGCELQGCCPGCPDADTLNWRISLNPDLLDKARLDFQDLDLAEIEGLLVNGAKPELDANGIWLEPGETLLEGLPADQQDEVPTAYIQAFSNTPNALRESAPVEESVLTEGIIINQYLAEYLVNTFSIRLKLLQCPASAVGDQLTLSNLLGGSYANLLMDYRDGPLTDNCKNDFYTNTVDSFHLENAWANAGCPSALAAFARENAMYLESPVAAWTDATGDVHTITLEPLIDVPITIWLTSAELKEDAETQLIRANYLFQENRTGIRFSPGYPDITDLSGANTLIMKQCPAGKRVEDLQNSVWYDPGKLNIYFVAAAFTGSACFEDHNMIYVGTTAASDTLAHEFGHAFGLRPGNAGGHAKPELGFASDNIMFPYMQGSRSRFSMGQTYRLNAHSGSMLNINGHRSGLEFDCPPLLTNAECPELASDGVSP